MNNDLLRQRRNIILISGALLIYDFAQVRVTKVSLLGTELLVGNPDVLISFAWFLWFYFLLRYYQYLRAETDLGIISAFYFYFRRYAVNYAVKTLPKKEILCGEMGMLDDPQYEVYYKDNKFSWKVRRNQSASEKNDIINLPLLCVFLWILKSLFYLIINTSKVTDHVIPLLLAISVPLIKWLHN